ncbi:MAG: amidohydrolase [Gemmatimonadota bacterium]
MSRPRRPARLLLLGLAALSVAACGRRGEADLVLRHARVYSLGWSEPKRDGHPAADAPWDSLRGWRPDGEAIAIRDGRILEVGSDSAIARRIGARTEVRDLAGATVIPGLVDAHTHVAEWGETLDRVDLTGVPDAAAAIARVVERARSTPKGEWILGQGWDDGAWADRYPDADALSAAVPDHPVVLRGLHGFASWANRAALAAAGITRATADPAGGAIRRRADGTPSGLFLNRAVALLDAAVPRPAPAVRDSQLVRVLRRMAGMGYTAVHEAGTAPDVVASFERLAESGRLPIRVSVMLSARDSSLMERWIAQGPRRGRNAPDDLLTIRTVKAYYDGALGSRGAELLADYSDRPGTRGVAGAAYGFDRVRVARAMAAGFQVAIHAIGDAGNRAALQFIDSVQKAAPQARNGRHRVEHAQVVAPADVARIAELGVIASVQPPHAVEDAPWAEQRVGPARIQGAYAWRTFRRAGASLVLSSDLPGSDADPFYGLHSAVTRTDRQGRPTGGWYPAQALTVEEAVRGYTRWARRAAFQDDSLGVLKADRWADLTVLDRDPFTTPPGTWLGGKAVLTLVRGQVVGP